MEIKFKDTKLKQICEQRVVGVRKLGDPGARKLRARLSDLEAVSRVTDLVAGNPHPLEGDRRGHFALDLAGGLRLTFESANDPTPRKEDGSIDWSQVTIIRINYIGDYHD